MTTILTFLHFEDTAVAKDLQRGFNCSERGETALPWGYRQAQTRTGKKRKADRMSQINFTSIRTSLTPLNSD